MDEKDYQSEKLLHELVEESHNSKVNYQNVIRLMSSKEKIKCYEVSALLKFHIPNRHNYPEEYCPSMLSLLFSFQNDSELRDGHPRSYSQKLADQTVIYVVNENRALVERYADFVKEVIENLQFHENWDIDTLLEKYGPVEEEAEKNEMEEDDITLGGDKLVNVNVSNLTHSLSNIENDGIINAKIGSLNIKSIWSIWYCS